MSRLEDPELIRELRELRTDSDTYKTAQRAGGDSLLGYLSFGQTTYDSSVALTAGEMKRFILTYTFGTAKDGAIIDLFPFYAIDNTAVMANSVPPWANGALILMYVQPLTASTTTMQWYIALRNTDASSHTAYVKYVFNGTDTGTWALNPA